MKTVTYACLVAAVFVLEALPVAAPQSAKFRHLASIYADDKGAGFSLPEGVACGAAGQFVVGDSGNDRLVRFTFGEKTVSGGSEMQIPELAAPVRVHLNSKGDIYALDRKARRIVHLSPDGAFKDVLSFEGAPPPTTIVPKSFTIDSADNIYVLDVFSARVIVLNVQGKFQRVLTFPDDIGFATDLAVDEAGGVLLLDSIKRRLFLAGKDATAFAPLGGDLVEALATPPTALMASKSSIFVLEGRGSSLVSFRRDGTFIARQLTLGAADGSLNQPSQMCINDKDEVFIADRDNSRVQIFQMVR